MRCRVRRRGIEPNSSMMYPYVKAYCTQFVAFCNIASIYCEIVIIIHMMCLMAET